MKTELRIQGQQLQIVQTFKDGAERLFYADEDHQEFREDMGEPKKVANRFILKKSQDEDKTVLRRNEYIGDLDGTHLILQTNCQLQLLNKNKTLWSITPQFRHEMSCVLNTDERGVVGIFTVPNNNGQKGSETQRIMQFDDDEYFGILETWITFEDDQPVIIQTLRNGSKVTYTSGLGLNNGLKLKRKPRQLAEKTLHIFKGSNDFYTIERMDYIGNLTGLHLIFEQNCSLLLVNGNQKLWELQPNLHDDPLMDCLILFKEYGSILLERKYSSFYGGSFNILTANYDEEKFITGYQFTLENNHLVVTRQLSNRSPDIFLAGPNTQGTLLQMISEGSVLVNGSDKQDLSLPKMGFIGDVNGVYAVFKEDCNWVLYNKTEMIWESGTSRKEFDRGCALFLTRNGSVMVTSPYEYKRKDYFWSTQNLTTDPEKDILKTELLVNNAGLWLINTYTDGTGKAFKALEGTHHLIHVPNEQ